MSILGYQIELALILQLGTSALLIGLYAATVSLKEQEADHLSDCRMVLFASFLFSHHPSVDKMSTLSGSDDGIINDPRKASDLYHFNRRLEYFRNNGALPDFATAAKTNIIEHLLLVLVAPLASVVIVFLFIEERRFGIPRIRDTDYRKNTISKMIFLATSSAIFIAIGVQIQQYPTVGACFIVIGALGVFATVIGAGICQQDQQSWKRYWTLRFLEVMAVAERDHDHDLFNRAMILSVDVESKPDLPLPGSFSLYAAVYTTAQVAIIFLSSSLHLF